MMKMMSIEIPREQKAKIALVNEDGEILTLRRSQDQKSRPGEWDWPGGKIKDKEHRNETTLEGLFREVEGEEMPGTRVVRETVTLIYAKTEEEDGVLVTSRLYAGVGAFPEGGIALSSEHDLSAHKPREEYPGLGMPGKYETGLVLGEQVINYLAELQRSGQLDPRAVLLGQAA